jgi:parallel beta-helix repeat protein
MKRGLGLLLALVFASAVHATVIHVPGNYTLIQAAVNAAVSGDTVLVAAGTYDSLFYPPGADTTRCVVYMKSGVSLIGAGIGQSIIDAGHAGRGIYCNGVATGRIQGFTIRNSFAQLFGAGIYCFQGSSPTIANCRVAECGDGGIICAYGSSPSISACTIVDNVYKEGGGMAIEQSSSPTITNCTIRDNSAPSGGGIFIRSSSAPVFVDCVIDSNFLTTANASGGGVAIRHASPTFRRCTIDANTASASGGGLDIRDSSDVMADSCRIRSNQTTDIYGPGGGIYCEMSDLDVLRSEVSHNRAEGTDELSDGGGLFIFYTDETYVVNVTNCTIVKNRTKSGGLGAGIFCNFANPTIQKSIIALNEQGKGIHCESSSPSVSCTDIYGNSGGDAVCGTDAGGNFSADPLFCNASSRDYTLRCSSPCVPGNHPNGAACSWIGAYRLGSCNSGVAEPEEGGAIVRLDHLAQPNPFGLGTTIHFGLAKPGRVKLAVYDLSGRQVRVLEDADLSAGRHQAAWDARDEAGRPLPSGVYLYRIEEGGRTSSGRLVLTR